MFAIVIIAVVVVIVAAGLYVGLSRRGGGHGLKQRFGPEYDRTVTRHDGDTKAADEELHERVKQHGALERQPISAESRATYQAQWADIQEQFVESPQKAVAEADALLARLAKERGFPDGEQFGTHLDALSVHHADQVEGYRMLHTAVRGQSGTEEMREAMVEAKGLFGALLFDDDGNDEPADPGRRHAKESGTR
ncbi:hypothetical protein [Streptomyces sp. NBC_01465]|uniref:hypothetical protein n=1 Tax=Streptomyces sp. NBC_01465 TaxID=2903878 RepID=UPI002E33983C|nr:hypothetical protein [Streptomyces sp. NBC_01465]